MRLTNVDNEKVDASPLTPRELLERSNLGAERWSGVRAEDERHRQLVEERPEVNHPLAIGARQLEVRSEVADRHYADGQAWFGETESHGSSTATR